MRRQTQPETPAEPLLAAIRSELDSIDLEILALLNRRAQCSLKAGALKAQSGAPVFRAGREELLLENLLAKNTGALPDAHLRAVYREILSSSRALQRPLKAAFLGPEGTFSHMAALEFFGRSMDFCPMPSFEDIFAAVENGDSEIGVIPLENSLHGSVVRSIDLFAASGAHIQAEWFSRISHCLMSRETNLAAIRTVYSHPQPLGQCAEWLRANLPRAEQISAASTAAAAHKALAGEGAAAIGHVSLAPRLGLSVLARNIEDAADNWTRFVAIGAAPGEKTGADKTSVLFTLPDHPGALAAVLQRLASARLNINKLESRPIRQERWKYIFFCDLACDLTDEEHAPLLEDLRGLCHSFRILGAYPSGTYVRTRAA